MNVGDIVRVGPNAALVIAIAHRDEKNLPSEIRVRFLRTPKTRWVLIDNAEVLSASR